MKHGHGLAILEGIDGILALSIARVDVKNNIQRAGAVKKRANAPKKEAFKWFSQVR
jgi:hypothetical protein